ncbi:DUF3459 domain-containing protein, partial [uncultured Nocardioides sp.]
VDVEPAFRQDPSWFRTGEPGRDGCRVPIPWSGSEAPFGFGPGTAQPWIPQPATWSPLTVAAQAGTAGSTLELYRSALATRRTFAHTAGDDVEMLDLGEDVLAFRRGPLTVALNCGTAPVPLPAGEVIASSGDLPGGVLPPDTAVWLR